MNTHQILTAELGSAVARLIKCELATNGTVQSTADRVVLYISRFEIEHKLGSLLQRIYYAVDQHFPIRSEDLSLIIRDSDGIYENCFKIWRSV